MNPESNRKFTYSAVDMNYYFVFRFMTYAEENWTLFILQRFINKLYNLYLYLSMAWMIIARVHQNIYRWYYLYNHHPIEKEFRKNVGQFLVNTRI